MWTYLLFRLAVPLVPRLPRPLLSLVGRFAGSIAYAASRSAREAVSRNLAVVLPHASPATRRRVARRTFVHGAWGYVEMLALPGTTLEQLQASYDVQGWEHLDAAIAEGQGVIMVTSHAGTPSAGGQLIALHGVPTTIVVEPLQPRRLHELVARLRGAFGVRIITVGRESVRDVIGALRRNELVGIVSDRDVAGSGRELPFFGAPTRVTTAAATLALRTNAVVLPAFASRTGLFRGTCRIEPAVEMPRTGNTADDVCEGTVRILARIEAFIHEYPEQWSVFSDVWATEGDAQGSSTIPKP
jgi:lauroyl/myristoyl acyltransferase